MQTATRSRGWTKAGAELRLLTAINSRKRPFVQFRFLPGKSPAAAPAPAGPTRLAAWLMIAGLILGSAGAAWAADTEPPSRPLSLTLVAKTDSSVSLTWNASTDNVGVAAYDIFCDAGPAGSSTSNSFVCTGLVPEQSYTFRVRARDAAGNVSDQSNALLATPQAAGLQAPPALVRTQFFALVLNYNPWIYANGSYVRADDHYGSGDVDSLIAQYITLFKKASGGQMNWSVISRFDLNEWAPPEGSPSPVFDATNCVALREMGYEYRASYSAILHDPRFDIIAKANQVQLDAIWVFGPPGVSFWETAMAGPRPYWINGAETLDDALNRNIVFYGFGKAGGQGVGFMCENTCHMTEIILNDHLAPTWPLTVSTRTWNTLNLDNPARALTPSLITDWKHFIQAEASSWDPILVAPGSSQVGLSHFPPTALYNYDWNTLFLDFNNAGPFHAYDGAWSLENGEYHVVPGKGVKVLALDGMTLRDGLGDYHPPEAFSDADVELTVRVMNGSAPSSHAGFLFRVSRCAAGPNQVQGYYLGLNACQGQLLLAKLDNSFTLLTNAPYAVEANVTYRLRLEARGSRLNAYLNDNLKPLISLVDSSYITGGFGLTTYATEAFFDNLSIVTHTVSTADKWYGYPDGQPVPRDLSPLEWDGDRDLAMDAFYAWWWEHLPKNGGGHYATSLSNGARSLLLNNWWPYVFDHNRFSTTRPFPDIAFPPEDVTAPSAPSGAIGIALGASKVGLAWNEASDNVGVTRYTVYRDGAFLRKTTLPCLVDTRLSPGTHYTYLIQACDGSGNASVATPVALTTLPADSPGTVVNGGFEFNPQASGWLPEAFLPAQASFQWEPSGTGRHGSRCVSIAATSFNDARWVQTVTGLTPGETCWLTGWIKGSNIVREPDRIVGANLCLNGTWEHAPDLLDGNFDWRQFSFAFIAPPSGTITVGCRLGFWSNCARGKVWFDDIAVVRPVGLRLGQPQLRPGDRLDLELVAAPLSPCRIEQSTNLQSWSEVQSFTPTDPITEISVPLPASAACFYRAARVSTATDHL